MSLHLANDLECGSDGYIYRVLFDASVHPAPHGQRLTRLCSAVQKHNEALLSSGRRHMRGWETELRGDVEIEYAEPWDLEASMVSIHGLHCRIFAKGPVPTLPLGAIDTGQIEVVHAYAAAANPGDILYDPATGAQAPVEHTDGERITLAFPWPGVQTSDGILCRGRVVRLRGEGTTFPYPVSVYCTDRWSKDQRAYPVTAISHDGWDGEDGFITRNFDHPGDYNHANVHMKEDLHGAINGVRLTGGCEVAGKTVQKHGELLEQGLHVGGAAVLGIANTMKTEWRIQMNTAFRAYLLTGGHKMGPLEMAFEGPGQMLWAPTGVASCYLHSPMNHQNCPTVPRDMPWIDLGKRPADKVPTHLFLDAPFMFFQWGRMDRTIFCHADADSTPVYVTARGHVNNFNGTLWDLPKGSVIHSTLEATS